MAEVLSPGGSELDVDGLRVPAWLPGDDDFAERLQVDVVWSPHVFVNGREVLPMNVPILEPPLYTSTARLFRRGIVKGPVPLERLVADELEAVAAALGSNVDEFSKLTYGTVESALRACLARRGFPSG